MKMQTLPKGQIIENGKRYYRADGKKSGYMRVVEKTYYDSKYKVYYWNNGANEIPDNCLLSEVDETREEARQKIAASILQSIITPWANTKGLPYVKDSLIEISVIYTDALLSRLDY